MLDGLRLAVLIAIGAGIGTTLVLSELRWFKRPRLSVRLGPYAGLQDAAWHDTHTPSARSRLAPVTTAIGNRLSALFGIRGDLDTRLRQAKRAQSVAEFRLRQVLFAGGALVVGAGLATAVRPAPVLSGLFVIGLPLLAFLAIEQRLISDFEQRRKRSFSELPIVSEQLAMLLNAGFSLGAAINRLAERGGGVLAEDLALVRDRTRHGVSIETALREWATQVDLDALHRLVVVLGRASETTDLGRLVSDEAKRIRLEAQRQLAATIERRGQQVWIPVTVATLVPGVIFLCIPFLQALELFAGS